MCFYKWSADSYEIGPLDESIMIRHYNGDGEQISVLGLYVDEAEEYVKKLQKAIKEAKKDRYYQK